MEKLRKWIEDRINSENTIITTSYATGYIDALIEVNKKVKQLIEEEEKTNYTPTEVRELIWKLQEQQMKTSGGTSMSTSSTNKWLAKNLKS